ncbi:hypothetical protein DFH06DRAFT_1431900 [Mycena polygramma]|nr:hypothetical protein DFH06DRAFT_1431900 [Mycena polygramma]
MSVGSVAAAQTDCEQNVGNDVISCYPSSDTVAIQDQFTAFVWNAREPDFTQAGFVDVLLFRADMQQQIFNSSHVANPSDSAGTLSVPVNDTWWGDQGGSWTGANISRPYFWLITTANDPDPSKSQPQATFMAVQTTLAQSLRSTPTTPSTSSASASSAQPTRSAGARKGSALRPALIVVGLLVGIALIVSALFVMRRRRRRRQLGRTRVDLFQSEVYAPSGTKAALNAEMRAVHARLRSLRAPSTEERASSGDAELHRQIAILTAEVERLRAMGAEEPPPYSESQPQLG